MSDRAMPELPTGTVTFLMTDVEGSTRQWEAHPDNMRVATESLNEILYDAIGKANGSRPEEQGEGDSVVAAFSRASDAVAAALDIQQKLVKEVWPDGIALRVRMGIHTGEVQLRGERNYFGPPLNRCARLRDLAHGGQILLSPATEQLVRGSLSAGSRLRDMGPQRMKDLSQPERVFQLTHPDLPDEFPPLKSLEALPNNLPVQLTSFVGRERDMEKIRKLISTSRLVTLTGAAGCGKTRLAVQVAANLSDEFDDGVWFVNLAAVTDPALVPHSTAAALSVQEEPRRAIVETLIDHMRDRRMLLIFDNCEHLLAACTELAAVLLKSCVELVIVATSREPLGVEGETSWRVPSLAIPNLESQGSPDELINYEGTRLFMERAVAVASDFRADSDEVLAISQICRRLDGIPLAIELAAAHVDVLTCEQIASRLDDQFRILTGGARTALERQQTMRAAVEWSYELLTDSERLVLDRLSVFVGGFSLEAAEEVCADETVEAFDVFRLLSSLVRKSLVISERRPHAVRYRLLETIKQYARDRLRESGEGAEVRARHRDWFLELAERAEPELTEGGRQVTWMALLEEEHDNLRAALEWCADDEDPGPMARLSSALHWFWYVRGYAGEGRRWFKRALERREQLPTELMAKALHSAGLLAWVHHDHRAALPLLNESLSIRRELDDKRGIAQTLGTLGNVHSSLGDNESAAALWQESLEIRRRINDKRGAAAVLANLAVLTAGKGNYEDALKSYEESVALNREVGDRHNEALSLFNIGGIWDAQGDYATSRRYYEEALTIGRELGASQLTIICLGFLGGTAFNQGDYEAARSWWEECADKSRRAEHVWGESFTRGTLAYLSASYEEGRRLCEKAAAISREAGEKGPLRSALRWAAQCAMGEGDSVRAKTYLKEALEISRSLEPDSARLELLALAEVAQAENDFQQAADFGRQSLPMARDHRDRQSMGFALQAIGAAEIGLGDMDRAAQLYAAGQRVLDEIGAKLYPHMQPAFEASVSSLTNALGAEKFDELWEAGRSMPLEDAIDLALRS
ncbi:MAG: tetratricopeptide repeat protein [Actinobacteria bacterium]|nr:tetratricopeptide repeat protein [Actinomycetota bacterium]